MKAIRLYWAFLLCICCSIAACTRRGNQYSGTLPRTNKQTHRTIEKQEVNHPVTKGKLSASEVFAKYNSAVFMIYTSNGWSNFQGSGFFVNSNGLAVSNYHVFEGTNVGLESIKLSDGRTCKIREVVAKSEEYDFILFYVELANKCNYIPISNRNHQVGEKVYTIGSPLGLANTFSSDEISQLRGDYVIQINAPIDHGSSGGALINEYGEVIGITSAGYDKSGANLNFAMDINVVKPYLP